ncbi:MAG TPA: response regulator [Thermoanaerobaculia bacterium]|jgi:CheY-like chemotaxis protein|nr:response regulator [Thermoanaerobaculia bacterium]
MNAEVEILIVEDNARDLELTMRALAKHNLGNRVVAVRDGAEALDFLFARGKYEDRPVGDGPHVIFLDMKLPKVDGIEVLRQIKADERTKTIPVVMVTSSAQERDMAESYRFGVNSYVVKPIDFDSFVKTIADLGFYWLAVNRHTSRS